MSRHRDSLKALWKHGNGEAVDRRRANLTNVSIAYRLAGATLLGHACLSGPRQQFRSPEPSPPWAWRAKESPKNLKRMVLASAVTQNRPLVVTSKPAIKKATPGH